MDRKKRPTTVYPLVSEIDYRADPEGSVQRWLDGKGRGWTLDTIEAVSQSHAGRVMLRVTVRTS